NLCAAAREVDERDKALAEEKAVHRAGFSGVEGVRDAAKLDERRSGGASSGAERIFAVRELRLHAEVAAEIIAAAGDVAARVLAGKAKGAYLAAGAQIRVSAEDIDARSGR